MHATGGPRNSEPGTLNQLFFHAVETYDKPDALQVKVGGRYTPISHVTLFARVRHTALGLAQLGVKPGERAVILSENRPEWAIVDYACLASGITDVPIYPNETAEAAAYILRDSGATVAFVSTAAQAAKVAEVRSQCPALRFVVEFDGERAPGADHTLAELEAMGAKALTPAREDEFRRTALAVKPDDVATIIYTSGTTGKPKGVMLSHDNLYSNVKASAAVVPFEGRDTCLSFLPLSHVFERMAGHYLMMETGTSIAYAESIDTVPENLVEVQPSLVLSVPRLYEKMYARVLEAAVAGGGLKKRIFFWARRVANRWADERLAGRTPGGLLALRYRVAQALVFTKLQARTGGRLRYFVSGGAPLSPEINKFFYAAGLVILEGYGLTETSPVICVNSPEHFRIGTVGRPVPGVEVKIADDGEILTRGPHIMQGYFGLPDATREAVSSDGWLATGDVGTLEDGFLRITDRKKDIIVTAGGKNIAPQPIENEIKTNKFVSQVVMIGDKRKFPSVLVVPDWEQLEQWARQQGLTWTKRADLLAMPQIQAKMEHEVFGQTAHLTRFEQPKKVALLEHEFTLERGELTPTLKVKRRVVEKTYKARIDALYPDEAEPGET
jgi:long-chain acyl-CoA synthetase